MKHLIYFVAIATVLFVSCGEQQPPKEEPRRFSVTIGDEQTSETRAEMVDGIYHWSVGDKVGLFVTDAGVETGEKVINNLELTGNHIEPVTHTDFTGHLLEEEISSLDPNKSYDYYTYYPYHPEGGNFGYPFVEFDIPTNITLEKNKFLTYYAPMVGEVQKNLHPITWLEEEIQQYGDPISFHYRHVMSFFKLELECNLMGYPVTSITIRNNFGTLISGVLELNLNDGTAEYKTGSNILNITFDDGFFDLGDHLYIPMPVGDYGDEVFTFTFNFANGGVYERVVPGRNFERGAKYDISFKLPFIVDFNQTPTLEEAGLVNATFPMTYMGWEFYGVNAIPGATYINIPQNGGTFKTPALNLNTRSGRTSIPVRVRVTATIIKSGSEEKRTISGAPTTPDNNPLDITNIFNVVGTGGNNDFETAVWEQLEYYDLMELTSALPSIGFYLTQKGGNQAGIRAIEIIPTY